MLTANNSKKDLRREILSRRCLLPSHWVAVQSAQTVSRVAAWEPFHKASTVMLYLAMPGEPQMDNLIRMALEAGKRVCVPALGNQYGHMEAAAIKGFHDLVIGKMGLRMPDLSQTTVIDPATIDFVLVPGVAFDPSGNRLGMGAGYYDRFLSRTVLAVTAGLAWEFQFLPCLEVDDHDIPVHYVISEEKISLCKRGKM